MRLSVALVLALTLLVPVVADAKTEQIEAVSRHYADSHPGLESYRVKIKTNKIDEMLGRMTASMPQDVPRPDTPELMKFWKRGAGTVVRSMTATAAPYMEQMINRFSQRFAIDLGTLFLPIEKEAERSKLLQAGTVKDSVTEIAGSTINHVEITFGTPTDLAGAFFGTSLDLPQRAINRLALDIDPQRNILVHMDIETDKTPKLAVDIRHLDIANNDLPSEVSITSPDGSIDEKLVTTFTELQGYHLPVKQERKIRRPGLEEELLVEFSDYELVVQ